MVKDLKDRIILHLTDSLEGSRIYTLERMPEIVDSTRRFWGYKLTEKDIENGYFNTFNNGYSFVVSPRKHMTVRYYKSLHYYNFKKSEDLMSREERFNVFYERLISYLRNYLTLQSVEEL
jgi:hypothetical protein